MAPSHTVKAVQKLAADIVRVWKNVERHERLLLYCSQGAAFSAAMAVAVAVAVTGLDTEEVTKHRAKFCGYLNFRPWALVSYVQPEKNVHDGLRHYRWM